jgi:hypothetical protein
MRDMGFLQRGCCEVNGFEGFNHISTSNTTRFVYTSIADRLNIILCASVLHIYINFGTAMPYTYQFLKRCESASHPLFCRFG